jgi:hypothetical protein
MTRTISRIMFAGLIAGVAVAASADGAGNTDRPRVCVNATLLGSYGLYRSGVTAAGPLAGVGIIHFDGYATIGTQSISRNGTFQFDAPINGTYEIASDCTGKFLAPDGTEIARVIVVDEGKGFYIMSETAGNAVYGVGRRIGTD